MLIYCNHSTAKNDNDSHKYMVFHNVFLILSIVTNAGTTVTHKLFQTDNTLDIGPDRSGPIFRVSSVLLHCDEGISYKFISILLHYDEGVSYKFMIHVINIAKRSNFSVPMSSRILKTN